MQRSALVRIVFVLAALAGCGDNKVLSADAGVDAPSFDAMEQPDSALAPAALTIAPVLQDFGSIPMGTDSSPVTFTVTNSGEGASGTISAMIALGSPNYIIVDNQCSGSLDPDETCTIDVQFSPAAEGNISGRLEVSAMPGGTATATLLGVGLAEGQITVTPTPFSYGDVEVSQMSAPQTFTVTNTGDSPTGTVSAMLTGTNPTEFTVQTNNCTGTLAAGATCTIAVQFTPATSGPKAASLSVSASPGGTAAAALSGNGLDPANIIVAPTVQNFGTVATGAMSSDLEFTVTNIGDVTTGTLASSLGGTDAGDWTIVTSTCAGLPLAGGGTCSVTLRFAPASTGDKNATLTVTGAPGGSAVASLTGTAVMPGNLSISPSPFSFGNVTVGTASAATTFTVTNTGLTPTGPISSALAGVDSAEFPIVAGGNGCQGTVLAPSATCTIAVQFTPATAGPKNATLAVAASPGGAASAALSGTGIAPPTLEITPPTQAFGSQPIGTSTGPQPFTVTNNGGTTSGMPTVTLGGTDFAQFMIVSNGCTAPLIPGGTCQVTVRYSPMTVGSHLASLDVSASPGGSDSAALSGNGVTPADIVIVPSLASFGTVVQSGTSPALSFTVTNTGAVPTGTLSVVLGGAAGAEYDIVTNTCTGILAASDPVADTDECVVTVTYSPTTVGTHVGTLTASATPGGSAVATLNGVSIPGITIAPTTIPFGQVRLDIVSPAQTFTVSNATGTGAMSRTFTITENFGTPEQFNVVSTTCPAAGGIALAPGGTCTINVTFNPTGTAGPRTGNIVVTGTPGVTAQGNVTGEAIDGLIITPDPFDFGSVVVGTNSTQTFLVQNLGGAPTGVVRTRIAGNGYHVTADACAGNVRPAFPDAGCSITVMFQPQTAAAHTGSLTVSASPGGTVAADLTGVGTPPADISITPGPLFNFGDVRQTNTAMRTFVVQNATGAAPTSPISIDFDAASIYTSTLGMGGSCMDGQILPSGGSCTITVTVAPTRATAVGVYGAELTASAAQGGFAGVDITTNVISQLVITPDPGDFGDVVILRTSTPIQFEVMNAGTVTTASLVATTSDTQFDVVSGSSTCTILTPGASCTLEVQFTPDDVGPQNASLTVQDVLVSADAALVGNGIDLPDLLIDVPIVMWFGTVIVGQSSTTQRYRVTNNGGSSTGPLATAFFDVWDGGFNFVTNGCQGTVLAPGAFCDMDIRFSPTVVSEDTESASFLLVNDPATAANPDVFTQLSGIGNTATELSVNPTLHDFGSLPIGTPSSPFVFTVVNNSTAPIPVTNVGFFGTGAPWGAVPDYTIVPGVGACTIGVPIPAGGNCTVSVVFTPSAGGRRTGIALVNNQFDVSAGITGIGTTAPELLVSPASHNFDPPTGGIAVNTTRTRTFVVTNVGATPTGTVGVTLGGLDTPHFSVANNNCAALAAQDSCSFQVVFQPTTTGPKSAEVTVTDAADPTDITMVPLSGTALNAASLSIQPSATQDYGDVAVGAETRAIRYTVRNATGSADSGPIDIGLSDNTNFQFTGCIPPLLPGGAPPPCVDGVTVLSGGETCAVDACYTPTTVADHTSVLSATGTPGGSPNVTLVGTGESALRFTAEPAVSPPAVTVGMSVDRVFTVQNALGPAGGVNPPTTGNLVVALGDASGQYAIITQNCVGTMLDSGDSCDITVRFTPSGTGPQPGSLTVSATPGNSDTANLNGQGQ